MDAEGRFVAQAHFDFDRTLWNVVYGSGRLFEKLGMHLVNDLISLQLKIVASCLAQVTRLFLEIAIVSDDRKLKEHVLASRAAANVVDHQWVFAVA